MNERRLRELFRRVALGSIPLSIVATGMACGTSRPSGAGAGDKGMDGGDGVDATSGPSDARPEPTPDAGGDDVLAPHPDGGEPMADAGGEDVVAPGDGPQPTDPCAPFHGFPGCGGGQNFCVAPDASIAPLADAGAFGATCTPFCGGGVFSCTLIEVDAADLVRCSLPCTGRRPPGLVDAEACGTDFAAYLAQAAHLEAASVTAFGTLRRELRRHGAPPSLLRAAARAARDEVRHARTMATLARRHGVVPNKARVERTPRRTLAEIAIENAVEGCVRETYGALVATYQSRAAGDADLRAAMDQIAKDETRHAALAWKIHTWADRRLEADDRRRVAEARREAVEEMASAVVRRPPSSVQRLAGVPGPAEATRMVGQLRTALWRS
jgi:hypothetical protein